MYEYKAIVTSVYDGDTLTALVDLGFHTKLTIKVRLYGIDTPELRGDNREEGLTSKKRLEELVLNKEVILKTYKDKQEKFGRWLADVFVEENTKSINDILIEEGLAKKYII